MSYLKQKEELPENGDWMFRVECDHYNVSTHLRYDAYRIISRTPKGVWVISEFYFGRYNDIPCVEDVKLVRKFILNDGKKRFAYETRDLAKSAFLLRKRRQIQILKAQLSKAENAYVVAGGTLPVPPRSVIFYDYNY